MNEFSPKITSIHGLSEIRRLPRLGMIRLGIMVDNKNGEGQHAAEVDYFLCPPEIKEIYGDEPKELDVMIPVNDSGASFPQSYKFYGQAKGLKCQGDGMVGYKFNLAENGMEEIDCPCNMLTAGKCTKSGTLNVILYKINMGGCYQIRTQSYNSIVDINSGLAYVKQLFGRFNMIPLKLKRQRIETHYDQKKQVHYTLQLMFEGNLETFNKMKLEQMKWANINMQLSEPLETDDEFDGTQAGPETVGPETMDPETMDPETVAPKTAAPETVAPETIDGITDTEEYRALMKMRDDYPEEYNQIVGNKKLLSLHQCRDFEIAIRDLAMESKETGEIKKDQTDWDDDDDIPF